ncbi:hypothetical protein PSPO01_01427 [Paraphaeosphaeria sporulosa]
MPKRRLPPGEADVFFGTVRMQGRRRTSHGSRNTAYSYVRAACGRRAGLPSRATTSRCSCKPPLTVRRDDGQDSEQDKTTGGQPPTSSGSCSRVRLGRPKIGRAWASWPTHWACVSERFEALDLTRPGTCDGPAMGPPLTPGGMGARDKDMPLPVRG